MLHYGIYAAHKNEEDTHEPIYQKVCYALEAKKTEMMLENPEQWERDKPRFDQYEADHRKLLDLYKERVTTITDMIAIFRQYRARSVSDRRLFE